MKDLAKQYEIAKQNAFEFMKKGQIAAYLGALLEMNKYQRLMLVTIAN